MTEEEIIFGKKSLTELRKEKYRKYGNKYQKDRTNLSFKDTTIVKMDKIKENRKIKTYPDVLEYLIDLDNAIEPLLEDKHECRKCEKEIDVPKNANIDSLRHKDLDKNSYCNGSIICKSRIKKDTDGIVIGNKLYHKRDHQIYCPSCKDNKNNNLKTEDGINFRCKNCDKIFELKEKQKYEKLPMQTGDDIILSS